jgi:uncharacterized protein YegL
VVGRNRGGQAFVGRAEQTVAIMLHVSKQSTLILYQGTREVARLSYKSDDASIDELFSHASMSMSKMSKAH